MVRPHQEICPSSFFPFFHSLPQHCKPPLSHLDLHMCHRARLLCPLTPLSSSPAHRHLHGAPGHPQQQCFYRFGTILAQRDVFYWKPEINLPLGAGLRQHTLSRSKCGPQPAAARTSPGSLLETRLSGPTPDLLSQNPRFIKMPGWYQGILKFEKHLAKAYL